MGDAVYCPTSERRGSLMRGIEVRGRFKAASLDLDAVVGFVEELTCLLQARPPIYLFKQLIESIWSWKPCNFGSIFYDPLPVFRGWNLEPHLVLAFDE